MRLEGLAAVLVVVVGPVVGVAVMAIAVGGPLLAVAVSTVVGEPSEAEALEVKGEVGAEEEMPGSGANGNMRGAITTSLSLVSGNEKQGK